MAHVCRQLLLTVAFLATMSVSLLAQEPKPAILSPSSFAPDVELTRAWRYHPGDDAGWANPALDDSTWLTADPTLPSGTMDGKPWPGVAWFRRHLILTPDLVQRRFAFVVRSAGRTDIWVDGRHVALLAAGTSAPDFLQFGDGEQHVLAVRYEATGLGRFALTGFPGGFRISFGPAASMIGEYISIVRRVSIFQATFLTFSIVLGLLHLALYSFRRSTRENLFAACVMFAFAGIIWSGVSRAFPGSAAMQVLAARLITPAILAAIFFTLMTYYAVRAQEFPRVWRTYAWIFAAFAVGTFMAPAWFSPWTWPLLFAVMGLEIARVERSGCVVERHGMLIMRVALTLDCAIILLQILIDAQVIPPLSGVGGVYVYGMVAFAAGMSLFLARNFAQTASDLETRLDEVRALTGRIVEQEREAHERALHARLLEAENRRASQELEQARDLQLSMLPKSIPEVAGLDVAVSMSTATEVGGDYYDFVRSNGGELVVAIGDATGHGVAAGTMVAAAKALFTSAAATERPGRILDETNRVLCTVTTRLRMCLGIARIAPRTVTFASAAIPPILIHRASNDSIEEIGSGALPLGGALPARYEEHSAPLHPGDTILLATDGLPELQDPEGNFLGFDGMSAALREIAGGPARDTLEKLLGRAAAWRGTREQADDMTLVVVRIL